MPTAIQTPELLDFWSKIADRQPSGSGPAYLSGWITAFCMCDEDVKSLPNHQSLSDNGLVLDDVWYYHIDNEKVPIGFASVAVRVNDNGTE